MKKLLVGPLMYPVNGQSLAFTKFVESLEQREVIVVDTNSEEKKHFRKIAFYILVLMKIFFSAIFSRYDVVYFTCSRSFLGSVKDVFLINLVSLKGAKIINHLHGSDFYEFLHATPKWYKKILFKSYNKVDVSVVLIEKMKLQFKDFKGMKLEVVKNFCDMDVDGGWVDGESENIKIVYLSNVMSSKGIFELIDAFDSMSKKNQKISLDIAGGFIGDEYLSSIEVEKVFFDKILSNAKINYLGKVYGTEKVELLKRSDIFVLPSYYKSEAFPISIIEGMACGNAIVTTNYKYLPDIIDESNGVIVEPKSVLSLISGLESLIDNRDKLERIKKHNKIVSRENYGLDNYIENLKRIVLGE